MRSWCTSLIKRRGIEGAPGEVHKPHAGGERLLSLPWSLSTVLDAQRSLSLSTLPREPWHKTQVWLNPSSCPPALLQVSLRTVPTLAWMILPSLCLSLTSHPFTAKTYPRCMRIFCISLYGFPGAGRWLPATSCKPCSTKTRGSGWAPKQIL